jgi:hypothetical protein
MKFVCPCALVVMLTPLAGCATAWVQNTEQMLAAAGFRQLPADTLERQNQLLLMPSHELLLQEQGGAQTYVYADPDVCHCLWVGDARNLQALQQLAFQQQLAEEYARATEAWYGPWYYYYPWGAWGVAPGHAHHPHEGGGHYGRSHGGGGYRGGGHGGGHR